jgi:hypothetical protein
MRFKVQKPEGYTFVSGQATDVSINTPNLKKKTIHIYQSK